MLVVIAYQLYGCLSFHIAVEGCGNVNESTESIHFQVSVWKTYIFFSRINAQE